MFNARVVGPLCSFHKGEPYLIKVPNQVRPVTDKAISCKPALCEKSDYVKGTAIFRLKDGTRIGLPTNSDLILARLNDDTYKNANPRKVYNALDIAAVNGAYMWNVNSDFRIAMSSEELFDGIMYLCTKIVDPIKLKPAICIPKVQRFRNKEIVGYNEPENETFALVDNYVDYLITLPSGKLTVNAYRLRISPSKNTDTEDPNKVYTVLDYKETGPHNEWSKEAKLRKLPQSLQDDLRRNRFDPFYRYGGL